MNDSHFCGGLSCIGLQCGLEFAIEGNVRHRVLGRFYQTVESWFPCISSNLQWTQVLRLLDDLVPCARWYICLGFRRLYFEDLECTWWLWHDNENNNSSHVLNSLIGVAKMKLEILRCVYCFRYLDVVFNTEMYILLVILAVPLNIVLIMGLLYHHIYCSRVIYPFEFWLPF